MLGRCLDFIFGERLECVLFDRLLDRDVDDDDDELLGAATSAIVMGVMTLDSFDWVERLRSPRPSGAVGR